MDVGGTVADTILDSIAAVAASETVDRGEHLAAGFEQILLTLFQGSDISQEELRRDLRSRIQRKRSERPGVMLQTVSGSGLAPVSADTQAVTV